MFLRQTKRIKDGKTHVYWSIVENKRLGDGRVVQRHVLYLGEINSSQEDSWRKAISVFDEDAGQPQSLSLFPEDRCDAVADASDIVKLRLSALELRHPRHWRRICGTNWVSIHSGPRICNAVAKARAGI
jgi:hypothetical protein